MVSGKKNDLKKLKGSFFSNSNCDSAIVKYLHESEGCEINHQVTAHPINTLIKKDKSKGLYLTFILPFLHW